MVISINKFEAKVQEILYTNLNSLDKRKNWKWNIDRSINKQSNKDLKKFIINELNRIEKEIIQFFSFFADQKDIQEKRDLLNDNLKTKAILKRVIEKNGDLY